MLDHVSITVSDVAGAEPYYEAIMKALEIVKVGRRDDWLGYGERARRLSGACLPHHPQGPQTRRRSRPALVLQGEVADPGRCLLGRRHRRRRQR
jgi:hypothetical protein